MVARSLSMSGPLPSSQLNSFAISCSSETGFAVASDFRLSVDSKLLIASPTELAASELSDNRRFFVGILGSSSSYDEDAECSSLSASRWVAKYLQVQTFLSLSPP